VSQLTQESSLWSVGWPSPTGTSLQFAELQTLSRGFYLANVDVCGVALLRLVDPIPSPMPQIQVQSRDLQV